MLLGALFRMWDLILVVALIVVAIGVFKIKNATEDTARKLDEISELIKQKKNE